MFGKIAKRTAMKLDRMLVVQFFCRWTSYVEQFAYRLQTQFSAFK